LQKQVEQNISARVKQFFIELRTMVKSAGRLARASVNMIETARGRHDDKTGRTGFQRQGKRCN